VAAAAAKVALLGAACETGQPLSLLLKMNDLVSELALYDVANVAGVAADLSHCNTPIKVGRARRGAGGEGGGEGGGGWAGRGARPGLSWTAATHELSWRALRGAGTKAAAGSSRRLRRRPAAPLPASSSQVHGYGGAGQLAMALKDAELVIITAGGALKLSLSMRMAPAAAATVAAETAPAEACWPPGARSKRRQQAGGGGKVV
jgi:hypothetical protein